MKHITIKNIKLTIYSKALWALPMFFILLLFFKRNGTPITAIANILIAFVMTGSLSSVADSQDRLIHADTLYCSLPIKRKDIIYAGWITGYLVVLGSVTFVFLSDLFIKLVFSSKSFSHHIISLGEILYLILLISIIELLEALFPSLNQLAVNNKLGFMFYITSISLIFFAGIPLLILGVSSLLDITLSGPDYISFHYLIQSFNFLQMFTSAALTVLLIAILNIISLRKKIRHYLIKDLD